MEDALEGPPSRAITVAAAAAAAAAPAPAPAPAAAVAVEAAVAPPHTHALMRSRRLVDTAAAAADNCCAAAAVQAGFSCSDLPRGDPRPPFCLCSDKNATTTITFNNTIIQNGRYSYLPSRNK